MVLYTGAGHQRIIFRCFVYSFVCRCLFTFHGARRGVGRRVARVVCYLYTDSVIQPRGSRRATHICSLLYLAPSGDGRYVAVGNLGSLPSLARRCRASREPGCIAGLLFIRLELRINSCTLNSELASASRGWATWRRPLGATRVTTCYDA